METSIAETCVETWSGLEKPVDVALFFNAIYHVPTEPRRKLLQLLNTTYLSPNGIIVMIENASPVTAGYIRLMHSLRLDRPNAMLPSEKLVDGALPTWISVIDQSDRRLFRSIGLRLKPPLP